ncbi:helix-turn-helix domain-containing protein [Bacillus sp. FJAT-50079]|uniref:helix-turn-helix domain-containing protein n=1 Tax=Bacillus sp. FJAT-50079 TaxID=2833577 RepID=UPI001BC8F1F3|nr:helix-turn-helix domain-containing protein [Bacillus sp. FJAT-50079]MBS4208450.1 helix-turn-helix transcriptional regulator [Bacillus sp. FJAT-50079]
MDEHFINMGEIIQSLRVYKGLDIEEVAEDICSVEELELIEKNKQSPTLDQLSELAIKLNVQLSDLFDFVNADSFNYVSAVNELIKKYKRNRNYQAIYEIVQREMDNPLYNFPLGKQYLLWHQAICLYYLSDSKDKEKDLAIRRLNEAIEITNPKKTSLTEREIEIKMAIAIIEKDSKELEQSIIIFKDILEEIDTLPSLGDPRVRLRALFGLAQSLSNLERYVESLIYCEKGIEHCINDDSLFLLGEFLYQAALNNVMLGSNEDGKEYLTKSLHIFNLQENSNLAELVKGQLEKIASQ